MSRYRCPGCGHEGEFNATGYVEYHSCVVDGDGNWVEDLECYDAGLSDAAQLTCPECGYSDDVIAFDPNFQ